MRSQQERSDVAVDLIDRLPTPFGLLRYGVAPDHVKMKSLELGLQRVLERPSVRFFGNVEFGRDVRRQDLLAAYDAIVYANGAESERRLQIPGEDLPGSSSARRFVAWYNAHPNAALEDGPLSAASVTIVGAGNVALDVARVLARSADEFTKTDIAEPVLAKLRASKVQDIYLLIRGGAERVKFTSKELRELGDLDGVDFVRRSGKLDLERCRTGVARQRCQRRKKHRHLSRMGCARQHRGTATNSFPVRRAPGGHSW